MRFTTTDLAVIAALFALDGGFRNRANPNVAQGVPPSPEVTEQQQQQPTAQGYSNWASGQPVAWNQASFETASVVQWLLGAGAVYGVAFSLVTVYTALTSIRSVNDVIIGFFTLAIVVLPTWVALHYTLKLRSYRRDLRAVRGRPLTPYQIKEERVAAWIESAYKAYQRKQAIARERRRQTKTN